MPSFKKTPFLWAVIYSVLLLGFSVYVLLDTFVIPQAKTDVSSNISGSSTYQSESNKSLDGTFTNTSYKDDNISISISEQTKYNTKIYIADITVSDAKYLKTAFADNQYGRNIKQTTSQIATANNAVFAINGDYYGFRNYGFVVRNGVLYRDTAGSGDALVIGTDGAFKCVSEQSSDANALVESGAYQILSFGPELLNSGNVSVSTSAEVSRSKASNPRTAIGMICPLHYIIIVSDGRTSDSVGLSLYQLADIFKQQGCTIAYNLDGGGSSTMWFNGKIVNNPTDGSQIGERKVSDIVFIG